MQNMKEKTPRVSCNFEKSTWNTLRKQLYIVIDKDVLMKIKFQKKMFVVLYYF